MATAMTSPERRNSPRIALAGIAYVNFENDNGGIVLNISEGGICFHSVAPLQEAATTQFWAPNGSSSRIEGEGKIVWADESQKRGGLRFANMSGEERRRLFDAICLPGLKMAVNRTGRRQCVASGRGLIRTRVPNNRLFHGFASGLVVGCLVSALIAGVFMSHRELGGFFIRLGELLGAKAETHNGYVAEQKAGNTRPLQQISANSEQPLQQNTSSETTKGRDAPKDTLLVLTAIPSEVNHQPVQLLPQSQAAAASFWGKARAGSAVATLPPAFSIPVAKAYTPPLPMALREQWGPVRAPKLITQKIVERQLSKASSGSIDQLYFEIGKFRQQFSAEEQTEKLATLGFPVTILQRRNLWINSYRVLVGPYHATEEAEVAHRNLLSRGFEPRPFERGSRDFVLPARLTLHGTQAPMGECLIEWESYISTVKVKFRQDNSVLATAEGVWVYRDPKYENSATVYTQNRDGSRTLSEIRFEGMNRTLVFP